MYFYRARYYDAGIGRFINSDPIGFSGGDVNFYVYVQNNPFNFVDTSGLDWLDTLANYTAGFSDALLFGYGDDIRELLGTGDFVNIISAQITYW